MGGYYPEWHRVLMFGAREPKPGEEIMYSRVAIRRTIRRLVAKHGTRELIIITGGAPGADQTVEYEAKQASVHVARVDALWDTRYKGAGPQRNTAMLALWPMEGIGFHKDISKSSGTKNMAKQLEDAGVPCRILKR